MTDLLDITVDDAAVGVLAGQLDVTATETPTAPGAMTVDLACGNCDVVGYSTDGLIVTDGPAVAFQAGTPAITRLAVGEIYTHRIFYGPNHYQRIGSGGITP